MLFAEVPIVILYRRERKPFAMKKKNYACKFPRDTNTLDHLHRLQPPSRAVSKNTRHVLISPEKRGRHLWRRNRHHIGQKDIVAIYRPFIEYIAIWRSRKQQNLIVPTNKELSFLRTVFADNRPRFSHRPSVFTLVYDKCENCCFQNQILAHNTSARIIWSNQSLVLQSVTRSSAGKYVCAATNDLNETRSEALHFRVKCEYTSRVPSTSSPYFILIERS